MKEATGELNMTVVTVVAIAAIAALLYAFVWPQMKKQMVARSCAAEYVENTDAYNQCVNEGMSASTDAGK